MRVVLLRPPRYVWPFNSDTSAFWPPLGMMCLAAAVRREMPELRIGIWDAPGQRFGWRTLEQRLGQQPIDVLGIGEEAVSAHEGLRAARFVRRLHPRCRIVAGGPYYAHDLERILGGGEVDVIVRGEGERTLIELLRQIDCPSRWSEIKGLAYLDSGRIVVTPPRPLIEDLDSLPFPAYDLVEVQRYGEGSRNHPALAAVEHSRGCIDSCSFCILWKHMGQGQNGCTRPWYRTKSAGRSFEEVDWLYRRFGRRTFGWVDPTFNASPQWSDAWAESMLRSPLVGPRGRCRTLHTAWVRADCIVRDHQLGILEKLVRAGLRQVIIGVERDDDGGLASLGKHHNGPEVCREAFALLRERYPQVFTIGTVIFGLPADDRPQLRRLAALEHELGMDYCFVMPLTPNPGTALADEARARGLIACEDLSRYNLHTPVCRTERLTLRELEDFYWRLMFRPDPRRMLWAARALVMRDRRKRRVNRSLLVKAAGLALRGLGHRLLHPFEASPSLYSRKPDWYDT